MIGRFNRVSAWNLLRTRAQALGAVFSTFASRVNAWLSGVKLGQGCRFYGLTTFHKARNASIRIGERCVFRSKARSNLIGINRPCIVSAHNEAVLTVGADCGFSGTVIGCFVRITIGDHVRCGANTLITDGDWHSNDPRAGSPMPVHIGDHVWLGVNVIVLKGVTIGRNSVIGAGSVVTKDVPENVVAAGNPCRVLRGLE